MNMRRHKHFVLARVRFNNWGRYWQQRIDLAFQETPEEKAERQARFDALWEDMLSKQAVRQLVEPEVTIVDDLAAVEEAAIEFVVAKVSTGEVVGTFDSKDDAVALINKHARQKKAKLMLVGDVEPIQSTEHSEA